MEFVERRRFPRIAGPLPKDVFVTVSVPARVVEISRSGAQMATPKRLDQGLKGRFRASIEGRPLAAEIEIRHVAPHRHPDGMYRFGASFSSLGETTGQTLEQLFKVRS